MNIERIDQYGQLLKQSKLTDLSTSSVPTRKEAIAQVSDKPKEQLSSRKGGLKCDNRKSLKYEKLRATMDRFLISSMSVGGLCQCASSINTRCTFCGLSLAYGRVIGKVVYDTGKPNDTINIRHIENPVLKVKILQGCRIVYQQF